MCYEQIENTDVYQPMMLVNIDALDMVDALNQEI